MEHDAVGHRKRLKERFLRAGNKGLCGHELLELLLCYSIPRRDVKPLAKELLKRFGSFEEIFAAEPDALMTVKGIGESSAVLLKLVREISMAVICEPDDSSLYLNSSEKVQQYLINICGKTACEKLFLLLFDRNMQLVDVLEFPGGKNMIAYPMGEIVFKVLCRRRVQQVIIAHNHPDGILQPSKSDLVSTLKFKELFNHVGITLLDHCIIGAEKCVSIMKMPGSLLNQRGK